jgi:hypothetical protein
MDMKDMEKKYGNFYAMARMRSFVRINEKKRRDEEFV